MVSEGACSILTARSHRASSPAPVLPSLGSKTVPVLAHTERDQQFQTWTEANDKDEIMFEGISPRDNSMTGGIEMTVERSVV